MVTDLLPEKVRDATESLYRLVKSEGEISDLQSFAHLAGFLAGLVEAIYDSSLSSLRKGAEGGMVRTIGGALSLAADTWISVFRSLQEAVKESADREPGAPIAELAELAVHAAKMREIMLATRDTVDFVNASWEEAGVPDSISRSDADFAAGRFQKGKEVLAGLRTPKSS